MPASIMGYIFSSWHSCTDTILYKRPCLGESKQEIQLNDTVILTVRPAVPMASSIPTLAAGNMTLGSLVMPGKATDSTTHVLISACRQLSIRQTCHSSSAAESQDVDEQESR